MKLKSLTVKCFKTFTKSTTFVFPQHPGLFFLTGRNEINPRLGANGVGKSTVWDAFCWLSFEKTPNGLAAGNLAPWNGEKGTEVRLAYEHDGVEYEACRTWSPNRWWIRYNGHEETLVNDQSNLLLSHLGVAFEPFLHSVLMAQGKPMFLDLKPEAMATLFGGVLQLDHWVDLSSKASKSAATQDSQSRVLEAAVARLSGEIDALRRSGVEQTHAEWEKQREARLTEVEDQHAAKLRKRKAVRAELVTKDAQLENFIESEEALRIKLDRARSAAAEADQVQKAADAADLRGRQERQGLEKELEELEHADTCDACGQKWEATAKKARCQELTRKLGELDSLNLGGKFTKATEDWDQADKVATRLTEAHERVLLELRVIERTVNNLEMQVVSLDKELDGLENAADRIQSEKNPAGEAMATLVSEKRRTEQELARMQDELVNSQTQHRLKQFWVKGFKDIRLQEITQALTQLEIEVNNSVEQLGLPGWRLYFDADSETKRGAIKRGFAVKVLSPENDQAVPWAAWSGGESQRLRIAGNMGQSDLIRDRLGISLPLEVWDEPTQFLSPQGVTDLLDSLKQRALAKQRQIWVVDHRSLGYGGFDGVVTVVKDRRGSRFEVSDGISNLKGE